MLAKLKIAQKIYLLGGILFALIVILGATSYTQMAKIGIELIDIAEEDIPLTRAITQITEHQMAQAILFERALFHAMLVAQDIPGVHDDVSGLASEISKLSEKVTDEIKTTEDFAAQAIKVAHSEKARAKFKEVLSKLKDIEKLYAKVTVKIDEVLTLATAGQVQQMANQATEVEHIEDELEHTLIALLDNIQKFTLDAALQAEHDEQSGIKQIVVTLIISLIVGAILPFIISRSITTPVNYLASRLEEVANGDGDLTVVLDDSSRDETGDVARAFNKFMGVLRTLISNTNKQADVLGESSETAMTIMRETVINVDKQRSETDMVVTAVTEMSATTLDVAKSAAHAAEVTDLVRKRVTEGQDGAIETQDIIKRLADEVTEAAKVIQNLVEETNNIGHVLESIQGIAAQTNLLALNAAIEAARAGESGRGFAVVADEVRSLAQRTQDSTVDIQGLVERLQSEANNAVSSMHKGSESAELCLSKSNETSKTFADASSAVGEISDLNIQIAAAAEEQSAVAEEINQNLVNISRLAEVTSEGAQETSDANTKIAKGVIDLHTYLNIFVV
jgi:methyl-accepting chemotaxis protein